MFYNTFLTKTIERFQMNNRCYLSMTKKGQEPSIEGIALIHLERLRRRKDPKSQAIRFYPCF